MRLDALTQRYKYGGISCGLALATVLIQVIVTILFDSYLSSFSMAPQRGVAIMLLVVPPFVGVLVGLAGVFWKDRNKVPAVIGTVLCLLVGAYYLLVVSFAG